MKVLVIAQARCGSSRLQNKVLLSLNNKSIIQTINNRVFKSKYVSKFVIATSTNVEDNAIQVHCDANNIECYRGDERDLINRYYSLIKLVNADIIIRLTCDCPYIDWNIMDSMIEFFKEHNLDYLYNTDENDQNKVYPEGSDIEIFNQKTINHIWQNEKDA